MCLQLITALVAAFAARAAAEEPRTCGAIQEGVCYYGEELSTLENEDLTLDECCSKCLSVDGCVAYRMFKPDGDARPGCTLLASHNASDGDMEDLEDTACTSGALVPVPTLVDGGESCGSDADGTLECATGFYCQRWNPWYYQCVPNPERCGAPEVGVDFFGDDLRSVKDLEPWECCDACADDQECTAYTFDYKNGRSVCYLKRGTGERIERKGAMPGTVRRDGWEKDDDARDDGAVGPSGNCGNAVDGALRCTDRYYCHPWNAWYYQCVAVPERCGVPTTDFGFDGDDLATVKDLTTPECCDQCVDAPECVAFTYVSSNADGRAACHLKSGTGVKKRMKGAIAVVMADRAPSCSTKADESCGDKTGTRCCPSDTYCQPWNQWYYQCVSTPPQCSTQLTDVEFQGDDLETRRGLKPEECCAACDETEGCVAYTFANEIAGQPACYLKSSSVGRAHKLGSVSGIVDAR